MSKMTPDESEFRQCERTLDDVLRRDRAAIEARGIAVVDESDRLHHYKNSYLSWRFRFEIVTARGSDHLKVWTVLSIDEGYSFVRCWTRAEIFQVGQLSRWKETFESFLPFDSVVSRGIATIVLREIHDAEAASAVSPAS